MNYRPHKSTGQKILSSILTLLWISSCAAPAAPALDSALLPSPQAVSVFSDIQPTLTPFQPHDGASPNPYSAVTTPQAQPTFTPYPTKYVLGDGLPTLANIVPSADVPYAINNPLTGLPVSDPSLLQRRPLAIKIGNAPDYVRPQSGLTVADVVYEYYIEWGETRFIGVFYSNDADRVGPVRSGRYFDEHIAHMYHAFLMFKGADPRELSYLHSTDLDPYLVSVGLGYSCPPYFIGPYHREGYNNIFFDTTKWSACAEKKGVDNSPQTISGGFFSEDVPQSPLSVTRIYSFYSAFSYNFWAYEPEDHLYFRYQEEKDLVNRKVETYVPLTDDYTRQPVTAENVVMLFVPYIFTNGNNAEDEVYNIDLIDFGNAYVFRDGIAIPARWTRTDINQPILLTNLDGSPIYLRPGQTFYEVMGVTSVHTQDGTHWRFEFKTP